MQMKTLLTLLTSVLMALCATISTYASTPTVPYKVLLDTMSPVDNLRSNVVDRITLRTRTSDVVRAAITPVILAEDTSQLRIAYSLAMMAGVDAPKLSKMGFTFRLFTSTNDFVTGYEKKYIAEVVRINLVEVPDTAVAPNAEVSIMRHALISQTKIIGSKWYHHFIVTVHFNLSRPLAAERHELTGL